MASSAFGRSSLLGGVQVQAWDLKQLTTAANIWFGVALDFLLSTIVTSFGDSLSLLMVVFGHGGGVDGCAFVSEWNGVWLV